MTVVVGLDGSKAGWVAVWATEAGFSRATLHNRLEEVLEDAANPDLVAVDIPIGIPEAVRREADGAARAFLKGAASTVFSTPPLSALREKSFSSANKTAMKISGIGLSQQSFALGKKILAVDGPARCDSRVFEVHPEVSFRAMAYEFGVDPLLVGRKKSWIGQQARRRLLGSAGIEIPDDIGVAGTAPVDDILDAAAGAWSALRKAQGIAKSLPECPQEIDGYRTAIWY